MYGFLASLSLEEAADEYGDLPTIVTSLSRKGWRDAKQSSLNEDLISRDRFASNVEMRKKIQKQQSLPDDGSGDANAPKTQKTLRESLMLAITRTKKFESLRNSLTMWRSGEQNDAEHGFQSDDKAKSDNEITQGNRMETDVKNEQDNENVELPKLLAATEKAPRSNQAQRQHTGDATQGSSFRSGIVRILQSWRSETLESGASKGSFTRKRGVSIQPIDIRGREGNSYGFEAANRRNVFQKRRGGSSPLSPKQLDALTKEGIENLSPTFRRCCMECPGGGTTEVVLYSPVANEQFVSKERKLSRGEASDSSSKEGSITSDTSIDSEDSCVSVIFVPHPERKVTQKTNRIINTFNILNTYLL